MSWKLLAIALIWGCIVMFAFILFLAFQESKRPQILIRPQIYIPEDQEIPPVKLLKPTLDIEGTISNDTIYGI